MVKNTKKEQISFNVSARTARLIGRENVATSEGAIIELVKNTYDADADLCLVVFDIAYEKAPKIIPELEFDKLNKHPNKPQKIELKNFYYFKEQAWHRKPLETSESLKENEAEKIRKKYVKENNLLSAFFSSFSDIYIIDNGEGMCSKTIKEQWMTIGTDNKEIDYQSEKGRIKSGAKGIGRFALDKLGSLGQMRTITSDSNITWNVDWDSFDQQGKNIDQIFATIEQSELTHVDQLKKLLTLESLKEIETSVISNRTKYESLDDAFQTGTILKISSLRDTWQLSNLRMLRSGLESVVPPKEDQSFELFFYSNLAEELDGRLLPETCDDFDYKVEVKADEDLNLDITINRNEFDINSFPEEIYEREFFQEEGLTRQDFHNKRIKWKTSLGELLPGISDSDEFDISEVGSFVFTFYFLKQGSSASDREKYFLKDIAAKARRDWLDNNSGVKVFRDNFRVRPYGEKGSSSWDWLELGDRVSSNPAAASRKDWQVSPANISGVINISRVTNPSFQDKSSREGLQESGALSKFKTIILRLIKVFENDRSSIFGAIRDYRSDIEEQPTEEDVSDKVKTKAHQYARQKYEEYKDKKSSTEKVKPSEEESLALAYLNEQTEKAGLEKDLEDIQKENFLLRIFASSGVTIASFTHELSNLQMKLGDRFQDIRKLVSEHISEDSFKDTFRFDNPFYVLDMHEKEDRKIKRWLQYTLRTIRKDKRKRKQVSISKYFEAFEADWIETIEDRKAKLNIINNLGEYNLRAYEIDLDCIFNNLIINSLDAFLLNKQGTKREIQITLENKVDGLALLYEDKGPGLSKDIVSPNDIFEATFTTKRDNNGKEIGTGMGMWLLKKTLEEYNAQPLVLSNIGGFGLEISFPHKYENKRN